MSSSKNKDVLVVKPQGEEYLFAQSIEGLQVSIEWSSLRGGFCDLDVLLYIYDDNARFIEKLDFDHPISRDGAFTLMADMDSTKESKTHEEQVHIDFKNVSSSTSSVIVFIDGGTRNFQHVSGIKARMTKKMAHVEGASNFSASLDNMASDSVGTFVYESSCVPRKDYQAMLGIVFYKSGFHEDGSVEWSCKSVFDPVMVSLSREKDEVCEKAIVNIVPSLFQYRPHLFPSVQAICAELSSTALPNLKRVFMLDSNGLPIDDFTKVIFMQLHEVKNKVAALSEAEYTVAMLHELFGQIDYNGDGFVDWDEFTTFCIYTGLITETSKPPTDGSPGGLDNYVIEYTDDKNLKDTTNVSFAPLSLVRHVPCTKKVLVIPDQGDSMLVMTERLGLYATVNPKHFIENSLDKADAAKIKVLDMVYIPCKDLICYSASDHSIVFVKELQGHSGKKTVTFNLYHRINHTFNHVKLCWSEASKILCSVNVDNTIFGWELDSSSPLFQINRHSHKITDIIALDEYGLFATCSLDKRIKLWSQSTRRMKGVLVGHQRGVRFLSHVKGCLLSAGFECEAKAWDLDVFEQTLTLRGHRHSISACQIMCRPDVEDDLRGLTVDQSGEFRLWDLFTKKGSDSTFAVTLQTFNSRENVHVTVNFLAIPYDHDYSNGQYSNFIAGTCCLNHFRPEKSVLEFVPPACMIYSESNCCVLSACGKNLLKYDIITGSYQACFANIGNSEISSLCMDGEHGRRVFVGFVNGYIFMINFATGQILSTVHAHTKAVSCLCLMKTDTDTGDVLYSGCNEGNIRMISEEGGDLVIHSTLEHATGDHAAIGNILAMEHAHVILATSIKRCWGVWHKQTFKRIFFLQEDDPISGMVVIGGGDQPPKPVVNYSTAMEESSRLIITLAVSLTNSVRIYSLNLQNLKKVEGKLTHILQYAESVYFSNVIKMTFPATTSLNYRDKNDKTSLKDVIVASTDAGTLMFWDIKDTLKESLHQFYETYPNIISNLQVEFADSVPVNHPPPILSQKSHFELGSISEGIHDTIDFGDDCDDYEDDFAYDSDGSDQSLSSLFSLTSAMGTVRDNVKADQNVVSSVNMTSIKVAKTVKVVPKLASSTMKGLSDIRQIRRAITIDMSNTSDANVITNSDSLQKMDPVAVWEGHKDSIIDLQVLGDSGCFVTISLDGFHRVWNLQMDKLGLLVLPNLTDEMKQNREDSSAEWLFLKEKIPVKPIHTEIATQFLAFIAERYESDTLHGSMHRRGGFDRRKIIKQKKYRKFATNNESRTNILMSLLHPQGDESPKLPVVPVASASLHQVSQPLSGSEDLPNIENELKTQQRSLSASSKANKEIDELKQKLAKKDKRSVSAAASGSVNTRASSSSKRQKRSNPTSRSNGSSRFVKAVFQSEKDWNDANDFTHGPVNAFSASSIINGCKDGILDDESHKILRILNKDKFRTKAFDRVVPGVQLRNVAKSAKFKFPDADVCHAEVSFGHQRDMYKNANHIIDSKNRVSSVSSNMNARHHLAALRLKQNITKAGPMTQVSQSQYSEDISLPSISLEEDDDEQSSDHNHDNGEATQQKKARKSDSKISKQFSFMNVNLSANKKKDLNEKDWKKPNQEKYESALKKVMDASIETVPHFMDVELHRKEELKSRKSNRNRTLRRSDTLHAKSVASGLERKLVNSIKRCHAETDSKSSSADNALGSTPEEKFVLKTRDLVPHYKLSDVKNFLNAFFRVDKNLSGYLDLEEWVSFFQVMNNSMSAQSARLLFSHVDVNGDGVLSLHELVPVIFAEASQAQVKLILSFIDDEMTRSMTAYNKQDVYKEDLVILFEAYDIDDIGYIKVQVIRDRIMRFQLPVGAQLAFNEKLSVVEDDDMVNLSQFTRMFVSYLSLERRNEEDEVA